MKRLAFSVLLSFGALVVLAMGIEGGSAAVAAAVAEPSPAGPAPALAALAACRRAPSIDDRVAVVAAWMRPVAAPQQLALKIDLQQRPLGVRRWTLRDDVPGLGVWISPSDPSVGTQPGDVFKYRQAVGQLAVPYAYRFRVSFRWSDDAGEIAREETQTTRTCRQPDLRPDLVPTDVSAQPSLRYPGLVRYRVVVRNDGRSDAAPVVVAATLPGDERPGGRTRTLPRLAPGRSAVFRFTGPGCAAGDAPALFVADPANDVEESDEANDELAGTCPAP